MEILGVTVPTWVLLAVPAAYLFYRYTTRKFDFFTKQGIKGPRPYPIVGTLIPFFTKGLMKCDMEHRRTYGRVVGSFVGSKPGLVIFDPDMAKQVMVKHFSAFINRQRLNFDEYPMNKMLTVIQDDHWKHVRSLLTPGFSGSRLRRMTGQMYKCAVTLRDNLAETSAKGDSFDIKKCSGNYTMDAIASTAFGLDVNSQKDPNNSFVAMANKAFFRSLKDPRLLLILFAPKLARFFSKMGMSLFPKDVTSFFTSVVNDAMKLREDHPEIQAKDFLDMMINAHIDDPDVKTLAAKDGLDVSDMMEGKDGVWSKTKLTHGEILAQSLLFFLAGYETTAITISYLAYTLALNPDKQDKLLEEIDRVTEGQEEMDYDLSKKMPYLKMCIDETLRMYPAAARTDRQAGEDITINGVFIPKGMIVGIGIYAMHYDPELWENPEQFIPERFTPEAKAARDPYSYLPFGVGPRGCIGMRLALLEIKMAIATILRDYKFVACDETEIPVKTISVSVSPANGIKLKLEPRK